MNTYFICATQYTNLGDLVINKMLLDELSKYGDVYLDFKGAPDDFVKPLLETNNIIDVSTYGFSVKRLSLISFVQFVLFLKKKKIKLLTRSPGPLCDPSLKIRLGFIIINTLARICGVKVVYLGNCCSQAMVDRQPLNSTYMNAVFLRSQHSVDYALRYLSCQVSYIPDLAFMMTTHSSCKKNKKVIIDYRSVPEDYQSSYSDLNSIVQIFLRNGYSVELYYQVKTDEQELKNLYKKLKGKGVTLRKSLLWYDEIENYYSDKAFVVSNRLHSLLFGAVYGAIPIARISDNSKVAKIKHVFENCLPEPLYRELSINSSIDIRRFIENEEAYRNELALYMSYNQRFCTEVIRKVMSNL